MMRLKFLKDYGSLKAGEVAECGDADGAELVERGIAEVPAPVSAPAVIVLGPEDVVAPPKATEVAKGDE